MKARFPTFDQWSWAQKVSLIWKVHTHEVCCLPKSQDVSHLRTGMGPYQQKKGQFSRSCYLGCKQGYVAYTKGKAVLAGSKEQPDGRKSEVLNCLSMSQCRHGPHGKCSLIFDPLTSWHPNTTADPVVALMSGFFLSCNHLSVGISPPEHFYTRWPDYCSG